MTNSGSGGAAGVGSQRFSRLFAAVDRLSSLDGWLGALCLVAMAALILTEVLLRSLSNVIPGLPGHIPVAWEYGSYLMAAAFTFGAGMTLRAGGHIRVNLLLAKASKGFRRVLEIGSSLVGFLFTSFLTYSMVRFSLTSFERGTTAVSSDTPLWIPQILITFGISLLALQFLTRFLRAVLNVPLEDHSMRPQSSME